METVFSLGDKLRHLRGERNISQRDLARLAGLSPNSISLIERDETSPVWLLCKAWHRRLMFV